MFIWGHERLSIHSLTSVWSGSEIKVLPASLFCHAQNLLPNPRNAPVIFNSAVRHAFWQIPYRWFFWLQDWLRPVKYLLLSTVYFTKHPIPLVHSFPNLLICRQKRNNWMGFRCSLCSLLQRRLRINGWSILPIAFNHPETRDSAICAIITRSYNEKLNLVYHSWRINLLFNTSSDNINLCHNLTACNLFSASLSDWIQGLYSSGLGGAFITVKGHTEITYVGNTKYHQDEILKADEDY